MCVTTAQVYISHVANANDYHYSIGMGQTKRTTSVQKTEGVQSDHPRSDTTQISDLAMNKGSNYIRLQDVFQYEKNAGNKASIHSDTLLGTSGQLNILHNGEQYFLRRTKQGKLILTK